MYVPVCVCASVHARARVCVCVCVCVCVRARARAHMESTIAFVTDFTINLCSSHKLRFHSVKNEYTHPGFVYY